MMFQTTIYGEVEVPVTEEGLPHFLALRLTHPRLRVEVKRNSLRFLLPMGLLRPYGMQNVPLTPTPPTNPRWAKVGSEVRFG